ncbi:uncharacterized protein METZ01_LOCUS401745, partial [marine metagenome]
VIFCKLQRFSAYRPAQPMPCRPTETGAQGSYGCIIRRQSPRFDEYQNDRRSPIFHCLNKRNVARHMVKSLVRVGDNSAAQPYLAESWNASENLKTGTSNLRKDAKG